MSIKRLSGTTPSRRFASALVKTEITTNKPEKGLIRILSKQSGRDNRGHVSMRHQGGREKRFMRVIDWKRDKKNIKGVVVSIEYDPNRNVSIALIVYKNGAKAYILAPEGLIVDSEVLASVDAEAKVGCCLPLAKIPVGFFVHNVELTPGRGGKFARSAGTSVQLMAKEGDFAILKMPSSEIRKISLNCWATIGVLSNADHRNVILGKAGRSRHLGVRPTVRGMAMNPVDHPHGGGEGRSKSGSHPVTPWGKCCKGMRTRKKKDFAIIRRRKS